MNIPWDAESPRAAHGVIDTEWRPTTKLKIINTGYYYSTLVLGWICLYGQLVTVLLSSFFLDQENISCREFTWNAHVLYLHSKIGMVTVNLGQKSTKNPAD